MTTPLTRADCCATLESRTFDLLVIGGGITGCGIARDAALRGLSVALVEKNDFASGTSSRSSRLVHGGLRYLEHGHLRLVFESSNERRRLLSLAPHLVRPLAFTWPVYQGARLARWKLGAGLWMYDALALFRNVERHRSLNRAAVLRREPALLPEGLRGGALYYDAATDDARLTLANAIGAAEAGAVVLNHASVTSLCFDGSSVVGASVQDTLTQSTDTVRARVIVNATGPWSDNVRRLDDSVRQSVRGSKGVHISVPRERIGNHEALTLLSPSDGRVFFVLPSGSHSIIGTTDTFTSSSPDDVRASHDDVDYLLAATNAFFPAAKLVRDDVVSAWAGIRPLLATSNETPGAVSREHAITTSTRGLISITGGKLTTYRVMAADVVNAVYARLDRRAPRNRTIREALPGGAFRSLATLRVAAGEATGDEALASHLVTAYGSRWPAVFEEMQRPGGAERVDGSLPYTFGELAYSLKHEMAATLGDLLIRRTHLAFETRDHGASAARTVAARLATDAGWSEPEVARQIDVYDDERNRIFCVD